MSPITSTVAVLLAVATLTETIIVPTGPVATSYASIVRGDGSRYGYGIAHGPYPYGGIEGESYPHGYGGLPAAYAPTYTGYDDVPQEGLLVNRPLLIHDAPLAIPVREYPYSHGPYPYRNRHIPSAEYYGHHPSIYTGYHHY